MATNKPRVTVTLEPEHYAVLSELASISSQPMSKIVSEIIGEAMPVFARVVKLAREAEAARASIGDRVKELATEAELQMLPIARDALKTFDMFDDAIMTAIKSAKEAEDGADASGSRERTEPAGPAKAARRGGKRK